jgi:hypothetical protein
VAGVHALRHVERRTGHRRWRAGQAAACGWPTRLPAPAVRSCSGSLGSSSSSHPAAPPPRQSSPCCRLKAGSTRHIRCSY